MIVSFPSALMSWLSVACFTYGYCTSVTLPAWDGTITVPSSMLLVNVELLPRHQLCQFRKLHMRQSGPAIVCKALTLASLPCVLYIESV